MRSVIGFWLNEATDLHTKLPLLIIAEHAAKHGYNDEPIAVPCFKNFQKIPPHYRDLLREWNFHLFDAASEYQSVRCRFPHLADRHPFFIDFLLRWLVLEKLFPGEALLAWDGDIFFNESLSKMHALAEGHTFTATSTCLVSISDPNWFATYRHTLERYEQSPDAFEEACWHEAKALLKDGQLGGPQEAVMGRWIAKDTATLETWRARLAFSAEEYLVDHLIRAEKLPHQLPPDYDRLLFTPQLLILPELAWVTPLPNGYRTQLKTPMSLTCESGVYYINGARLAFVHFQSALHRYCAAHHVHQHFFNMASRVKSELYPGSIDTPNAVEVLDSFNAWANRNQHTQSFKALVNATGDPRNRCTIANHYMNEGSLEAVLNDTISDKPHTWSPSKTNAKRKPSSPMIAAWDAICHWPQHAHFDPTYLGIDCAHLTRPLLWERVGRALRAQENAPSFARELELLHKPDRIPTPEPKYHPAPPPFIPEEHDCTRKKIIFYPVVTRATQAVMTQLAQDPDYIVLTKDRRTPIPGSYAARNAPQNLPTHEPFARKLYQAIITGLTAQGITLLPRDAIELEHDTLKLIANIAQLETELRMNRVDAMVFHADNFHPYLTYTLLARQFGIASIMIQHGLDCEHGFLDEAYADAIAVWGPHRLKRYQTQSTFQPKRIQVCGLSAFDSFAHPDTLDKAGDSWLWITRPHQPDKCYTTQRHPIEGLTIFKAMIRALEQSPNAHLTVKLHHNDYYRVYAEFLETTPLKNRITLSTQGLDEALQQSDLVFSEDSSAALEAIFHGKVIINTHFCNDPPTLALVSQGAALPAFNQEQLLNSVNEAYQLNEEARHTLLKKMVSFLKEHAGPCQGQAEATTIQFIKEAIRDLSPSKRSQYHRDKAFSQSNPEPTENIILFGSGQGARIYFESLPYHRNVIAFADNNSAVQGNQLFDRPIISPDSIADYRFDKIVIASTYHQEIRHQLLSMHFQPHQIETLPLAAISPAPCSTTVTA